MKTHCRKGHEFTPENTRVRINGWRQCRICTRAAQRSTYVPHPKPPRTHCKRGHEYTPENTLWKSRGPNRPKSKECRECDLARRRALYPPRPPRTTCPQGHEWTPENTYRNPSNGSRTCRTCARELKRAKYVPRVRKHAGPTGDHGTPQGYNRGCRCTYCRRDHAIIDELIVRAIATGTVFQSEVPPLNKGELTLLKKLRDELTEADTWVTQATGRTRMGRMVSVG